MYHAPIEMRKRQGNSNRGKAARTGREHEWLRLRIFTPAHFYACACAF
jgi:hypothetical protein